MTSFHHIGFLCIYSECEKIRTTKTANMDTFHVVHNKTLIHSYLLSWVRIFSKNSQKLHEKCLYLEFSWSSFSRIQTEYGKILWIFLFSVQMGENTGQKNSKYGHFSRSEDSEKKKFDLEAVARSCSINKGVFRNFVKLTR